MKHHDFVFKFEYSSQQEELITPCRARVHHGSLVYDCQAVWDTGANISCISPYLVKKLQLKPIDYLEVVSITGTVIAPTYRLDIAFSNRVIVHGVEASEINFQEGVYDVLIGANIIGQGTLKIEKFQSLSFSLPQN